MLPYVYILNDKKHFLARYIWKIIIILLNTSLTEGVTASYPKHRRWSLHLSAWQCTGSSCTSNSGAVLSWQTQIHGCWHVAAISPDFKPVDYCIWGVIQEWVYHTKPIQDMREPRQRVMSTSAAFQQSVVDETIDQWQKRLDAWVHAQGAHFEQLPWHDDIACQCFSTELNVLSQTFLTSSCSCKSDEISFVNFTR